MKNSVFIMCYSYSCVCLQVLYQLLFWFGHFFTHVILWPGRKKYPLIESMRLYRVFQFHYHIYYLDSIVFRSHNSQKSHYCVITCIFYWIKTPLKYILTPASRLKSHNDEATWNTHHFTNVIAEKMVCCLLYYNMIYMCAYLITSP